MSANPIEDSTQPSSLLAKLKNTVFELSWPRQAEADDRECCCWWSVVPALKVLWYLKQYGEFTDLLLRKSQEFATPIITLVMQRPNMGSVVKWRLIALLMDNRCWSRKYCRQVTLSPLLPIEQSLSSGV